MLSNPSDVRSGFIVVEEAAKLTKLLGDDIGIAHT